MMTSRKYPMVKTSGWGFGLDWDWNGQARRIRELEQQVEALTRELKAMRQAMREAVTR